MFFTKPIFHGRRFDAHTLPLSAVKALQAYSEAIQAIAKAKWREENPQRERVPKGFADFELAIADIDRHAGCVGVVLDLPKPAGELWPPYREYYTKARDTLHDDIESGFSEIHSGAARRHLVKMADELGEDEHILWAREPKAKTGPSFRRDTVRKLRRKPQSEDDVEIVGVFDSRSASRGRIELITDESNTAVHCVATSDFVEKWNSFLDHKVRIIGKGIFQGEELLRVTRIKSIELAEAAKLHIQFARLRMLGPGWLNPESKPLDRRTLERFEKFLGQIEDAGLPRPSLYGTEERGVRAEWTSGPWEVSLEAEPEQEEFLAEALNITTNKWDESTVSTLESALDFLSPRLEDGDTYGE